MFHIFVVRSNGNLSVILAPGPEAEEELVRNGETIIARKAVQSGDPEIAEGLGGLYGLMCISSARQALELLMTEAFNLAQRHVNAREVPRSPQLWDDDEGHGTHRHKW